MIFEFLMQLGVAMGEWILGLAPDTSSAANLVIQADNAVRPILAAAAGLGAWIPWAHLGICIASVLAFYLSMFLFKVARQLASYIPFIGGSG